MRLKKIKQTHIYLYLYLWRNRRRDQREYIEWIKNGKLNSPPHIIKQQNIKKFAEYYNLHIFVETGTCMGDMVHAMQHRFKSIYSIELDKDLYELAKYRFRKQNHIYLFQGDSAKLLGNIVTRIDEPALFWLDGHYSGGITARGEKNCPIYEELCHIFNGPDFDHIILIDDARCFNGEHDYPCISDLKKFVLSKRSHLKMTVNDDCIHIFPKVYQNHNIFKTICNTNKIK